MTLEIALWVLGIGVPATVVFNWALAYKQGKIAEDTKLLVKMHRDPDKYGFGTLETNEATKANTRAIKEMTHYLVISIENQTGQKPMPPIDT